MNHESVMHGVIVVIMWPFCITLALLATCKSLHRDLPIVLTLYVSDVGDKAINLTSMCKSLHIDLPIALTLRLTTTPDTICI